MEEIIQLQKREEAAQKAAAEKERQAAQKAAAVDQGPPVIQGQSAMKKSKEKKIKISEGAPQAAKTVLPDNAPNPRRIGKERWGSRLRLHRLLGNALARVEQLLWSPFLFLKLQIRGW